ncbi:anti-anti-sigma factor [Salimicrobium jeotgali]|uniref:Anti-sigma factor antagonist n=1 Tax=Salimicrobium jeotgali TaxID=1230341 RepID=K2GA23_9BACI|nr:STAS domain-containing protein [Salimicrobium jeotgali]AKG05375.1 anti-anti-sigma factor [Salimicrobium jeotgali]EKE31167.1 anti-sigma-B factor antagonist RsbV [Salimicrobium jeotgali]MBM7697330.1 anti-sigma B factor antagonist [Salimicrobium jeotgali]
MNLSIDVTKPEEKHSVMTLDGEVDAFTAPKLKQELLPLTETEGALVEVDLGAVNYMDSTGLGIFISALKSTKEHGSDMKLIHMHERVYRLFKITGLTEIMDINTSVRGGM